MLDELLKANKITSRQLKIYHLFAMHDLGQQYLDEMILETFMDTPVQPSDQVFAFLDGRRSIFREILDTIKHVNKIVEETNVG